MANIALLHHDLKRKGGGEAVCMGFIEALQDDHDITMFTLSSPNFSELNEYFQFDVSAVPIREPPVSSRIASTMSRLTGRSLDLFLGALLVRYVNSIDDGSFDLWISTINELPLPSPSLQYIHLPQFNRDALPGHFGDRSLIQDIYDKSCQAIAAYDRDSITTKSTFFANSEFTADIFEDVYGNRPTVLYPPVNVDHFQSFDRPWEERENGLVSIGRLAPIKGLKRGIRIVDGVRERGHQIEYHIAGPPTSDRYTEEVFTMVDEREYVKYHGELHHRDESMMDLLCRQRFYLNTTEYETFGISIAEMMAAGLIPFVHDSGGQREIVKSEHDLRFQTVRDAVDRLDSVLASPDRCRHIRQELGNTDPRFGRERFVRKISRSVEKLVG